ncbi:hypothetical protein BJX61DRAFT_539786 [Aspergillus egyptiacus]|nr:hypothetical protein BJX61DRAFT_539786 [Aspergillus egyptiacus]
MPEDNTYDYDYDLDSYQLYTRYEDAPPQTDWKNAALHGPALPTLGNAVAGAVGAAASNLATYPLSLIIARLQTQKNRKQRSEKEVVGNDEEYIGVLDAARKIYAREGLGGLYNGLAQDTVKAVLDAFLFFLAYEFFRKRRIAAHYGSTRRSKHAVLPVLDELAVGVLAGAFSKVFTTPLSNIVARKQTSGPSANSAEIASRIRSEKGLRGFWSGYPASLILTLNPSITFFFNGMLKYALRRRNKRAKPSPAVTFLLAAISKSAASSITYPFSMAKTRSQISGASSRSGKVPAGESKELFFVPSIISDVATIARTEGVSALYAGLQGEVLKGFFSHGFTMLAKDAVYAAIVRSYYLLLIVTRRYPSPEELLTRARERAEEYAEAAREGAKDLAEKAKSSTEEMLEGHAGNAAVDMTSNAHPNKVDMLGSNETAEMVGDYVEDEARTQICTDLLFQPLTLLDCLHTFCGACLKEWFHTQASSRTRSSSSTPRFTCPSCRASVRGTRANATVTTLLDMLLAANPERAKPAAEKAEIERRYKHGESVFPSLQSPGNSDGESDEEDRRILDGVRQMNLEETRSRTRTAPQSSRTRRTDSVDINGYREDGRSRRRREEERVARRQRTAQPTGMAQPEGTTERARTVEHQSSLRSLLSLSDTETMEEEILRQIFEEGLLDDIDLDILEPGQEEELSERIADAYRRRHMRSPRRRDPPEQLQPQPQTRTRSRTQSQSARGPQDTPNSLSTGRRSQLEVPTPRPGPSSHQRHLSEQGGTRRRRTSPIAQNPASSSDVTLGPTIRSSSDITPHGSRDSHPRPGSAETAATRSRRANSSGQRVPSISVDGAATRATSHTRTRSSIDPPRRSLIENPNSSRLYNGTSELPTNSSVVAEVSGPTRQEPWSRPLSSRSNAVMQPNVFYTEPSISCDRCGKADIQYDLHKTCPKCKDGDYHLCLRCYRQGRGCLGWKGFRAAAAAELQRIRASSDGPQLLEPQHILQSFKYFRPPETAPGFVRGGRQMTNDNPARRLQRGLFCDLCQNSANDLLWRCNQCNEGDWGFCSKCVNQGKCCTHSLLPICCIGVDSGVHVHQVGDRTAEILKVLSITTRCDICTSPIPTTTLRFHCLRCNDGDYDVCANCYLKLVATSKIRKEDGLNGWRRCLKGHRMVVIGFEDYPEGQRRVIARNLVGGHALNDNHVSATHTVSSSIPSPDTPSAAGDWSWKEGSERRKKAPRIRSSWNPERDRVSHSDQSTPSSISAGQPHSPTAATTRRFPPDGGVGLVVLALWSWYPEEGVDDELMFPRGAEITEAENINEDWYWGCYAGMKGLFPGSHVSVVGEVV